MAKKYNALGGRKKMSPERKNLLKKITGWLLGGGLVVVVSGAVNFGVSRENIRTRLDKNDGDHVIIEKKIDTTATKVDVIDDRTARIETNVEWLMKTKAAKENTEKASVASKNIIIGSKKNN